MGNRHHKPNGIRQDRCDKLFGATVPALPSAIPHYLPFKQTLVNDPDCHPALGERPIFEADVRWSSELLSLLSLR
jgi:hypothetical protein